MKSDSFRIGAPVLTGSSSFVHGDTPDTKSHVGLNLKEAERLFDFLDDHAIFLAEDKEAGQKLPASIPRIFSHSTQLNSYAYRRFKLFPPEEQEPELTLCWIEVHGVDRERHKARSGQEGSYFSTSFAFVLRRSLVTRKRDQRVAGNKPEDLELHNVYVVRDLMSVHFRHFFQKGSGKHTISAVCDKASFVGNPAVRFALGSNTPDENTADFLINLLVFPFKELQRFSNGGKTGHKVYDEKAVPELFYRRPKEDERDPVFRHSDLELDDQLHCPLLTRLRLNSLSVSFASEIGEEDTEATDEQTLQLSRILNSVLATYNAVYYKEGSAINISHVTTERDDRRRQDAYREMDDEVASMVAHSMRENITKDVTLVSYDSSRTNMLSRVNMFVFNTQSVQQQIRRHGEYEPLRSRYKAATGEPAQSASQLVRSLGRSLVTIAMVTSRSLQSNFLINGDRLKTAEELRQILVVKEKGGASRKDVTPFYRRLALIALNATDLLYWNQNRSWYKAVTLSKKDLRLRLESWINSQPRELSFGKVSLKRWDRMYDLLNLMREDDEKLFERLQGMMEFDKVITNRNSSQRITAIEETSLAFLILALRRPEYNLHDLMATAPFVPERMRETMADKHVRSQYKNQCNQYMKDVRAYILYHFGIDLRFSVGLHRAILLEQGQALFDSFKSDEEDLTLKDVIERIDSKRADALLNQKLFSVIEHSLKEKHNEA